MNISSGRSYPNVTRFGANSEDGTINGSTNRIQTQRPSNPTSYSKIDGGVHDRNRLHHLGVSNIRQSDLCRYWINNGKSTGMISYINVASNNAKADIKGILNEIESKKSTISMAALATLMHQIGENYSDAPLSLTDGQIKYIARSFEDPFNLDKHVGRILHGLTGLDSSNGNTKRLVVELANVIKELKHKPDARQIGMALYGLQRLNGSDQSTQQLVDALTNIIKGSHQLLSGQSLSSCLYGLQSLDRHVSSTKELIWALVGKIGKNKSGPDEALSGLGIAISLYGLQNLDGSHPSTTALVDALTPEIRSSTVTLDLGNIAMACFGLQNLDGKHPSTIALVAVLVEKIRNSLPKLAQNNQTFNAQQIGMVGAGLQNLDWNADSTQELVGLCADMITNNSQPLNGYSINNFLQGLKGYSPDGRNTTKLVDALSRKIAERDAVLTCEGIANSVYGFHNLEGCHALTKKLVGAVVESIDNRLPGLTANNDRFTSKDIGMIGYGLQRLDGKDTNTKYLVNLVATLIRRTEQSLTPLQLATVVYGMQSLDGADASTKTLVAAVVNHIPTDIHDIGFTSVQIGMMGLGLQNLDGLDGATQQLVGVIASALTHINDPVSGKFIGMSCRGLRSLDGHHKNTHFLVNELTKKVSLSGESLDAIQLGTAIFGLQNLDATNSSTIQLLGALINKIPNDFQFDQASLSQIVIGIRHFTCSENGIALIRPLVNAMSKDLTIDIVREMACIWLKSSTNWNLTIDFIQNISSQSGLDGRWTESMVLDLILNFQSDQSHHLIHYIGEELGLYHLKFAANVYKHGQSAPSPTQSEVPGRVWTTGLRANQPTHFICASSRFGEIAENGKKTDVGISTFVGKILNYRENSESGNLVLVLNYIGKDNNQEKIDSLYTKINTTLAHEHLVKNTKNLKIILFAEPGNQDPFKAWLDAEILALGTHNYRTQLVNGEYTPEGSSSDRKRSKPTLTTDGAKNKRSRTHGAEKPTGAVQSVATVVRAGVHADRKSLIDTIIKNLSNPECRQIEQYLKNVNRQDWEACLYNTIKQGTELEFINLVPDQAENIKQIAQVCECLNTLS